MLKTIQPGLNSFSMTIRFHPINKEVQSYPKPSLPVQPIVDISLLRLQTQKLAASAFFNKGEFFINARTALAQALISAGLDENSGVLIPAYHCGSMVEPALWLNAEVLLYKITPDLTPQQQHLEQLISTAPKPVRVLLLPHYFGFPQQTDHWQAFCNKHQLILIEDCAHTFFGVYQEQPIGNTGDYAIASARKFFGCADGGILISKTKVASRTFPPSISAQIKSALKLLLQIAAADRLGMLGKIINQVDLRRTKHQTTKSSSTLPSPNAQSWQWFEPDSIAHQGHPLSKWLIGHSHIPTIISSRRNNYLRLLNGIANITVLKPLFPILPNGVVPYMFPAILTSGEADFDRLKRVGVPLWRWEELADSDCPVSQRYRLQLLQIPCHQNLNSSDIDWLISQLGTILGKKAI